MSIDPPPLLEVDAVRFGYPSRPGFLGPVDLTVRAGECWAIVGPNGAGKSTLLRVMAGLFRAHAGMVRLNGRDVGTLSARRRARRIAFLPQHPPPGLDASAREVVLLGRFPHRSLGLFESTQDHAIAERALALTRTAALADRAIATLSGGETQRVHLAAAIAQEPEFLLLDEPTASLDLQHQLGVFEILRDRAAGDKTAVVVVTHDINLAGRFCSHILLLGDGCQIATGTPLDVLTPEVLEPVYGVELTTLVGPSGSEDAWVHGHRWVVPTRVRREGAS